VYVPTKSGNHGAAVGCALRPPASLLDPRSVNPRHFCRNGHQRRPILRSQRAHRDPLARRSPQRSLKGTDGSLAVKLPRVCRKDCKNAAIAAKRSRAGSGSLSRNEPGHPKVCLQGGSVLVDERSVWANPYVSTGNSARQRRKETSMFAKKY
jgi:hypothetical protein